MQPNQVFVARTNMPGYAKPEERVPPELPNGTVYTAALRLVRRLFRDAGLDSARYGTVEWNPLGEVISIGDTVLLKPNWVADENRLPGGELECLVTHSSVIEAVLYYVIKARPGKIVVGDAPIQNCDFENLRAKCELDDMVSRFKRLGYDVGIRDFRMTTMPDGVYGKETTLCRGMDQNILFDLGELSWLEPIAAKSPEFRVANYDSSALRKHHRPGTHRYLIAREVIDADVVISLPKLKMHQMAGVTGALKNMVGINPCKDYLPHHRKGGSNSGGDCYAGKSAFKALAEDLLDQGNRTKSSTARYCFFTLARVASRFSSLLLGHGRNSTGAWYGNDTVWRMCLDLQAVLHYGKSDGTMADTPQRRVITITDAIVAGDSNGPLAPRPVPLGIVTLGSSEAALEWVHCLLMGIDPEKIPLVKHAFSQRRWPLSSFRPSDVVIQADGKKRSQREIVADYSRHFTPAPGWQGHCELRTHPR